jgi:outer membrane receptor protein involved in Fe transport
MRAPVFHLVLLSLVGADVTLASGRIAAAAQAATGTIRVEVVDAGSPVAGVSVLGGGMSMTTDTSGIATLVLPPGRVSVIATKAGYGPATAGVDVVAGQQRDVRMVLTPQPSEPGKPMVVASTRVPRRLEEQAVPVEVLGRSRVADTMSMWPGDIALLLDGMRSVRAQVTSPELGMTALRLRGLRGHYTRLLSDGAPLDWDRAVGLAPVQIPPLDLAGVEVLTDGASAIFGGNTLAGVVNMLSRRPDKTPNRELLFSQSASGGTDGLFWLSTPPDGTWSSTTLVGGHFQDERDVDDDGWSDLAGHSRGAVRTRVLWDNGRGRSASGVAGVTFEKREGGSALAHQELETKEADGALHGQMPLGKYILAGFGTLFVQSRTRDFSDRREHERRQSATIEITLRQPGPRHTWLAGIASEWFANRTPATPLPSAYVYTGPSLFFHDEFQMSPWLTTSGSVRLDYHVSDGAFVSPRGSALVHRGPWAARISAGRSYFSPKAITEETEAAGLAHLTIDSDGDLRRETANSVLADLTHTTEKSVVSMTFFRTQVNHPALVDRATYTLRTESDPVVTRGIEILGTARRPPFALTGTYGYLRARERGTVEVALTPRHSASVIATAEAAGRGRISLQVHYTGVQRLDANPYRSASESYTLVHLLGELPVKRWRLFVNAENLTDVRQTNWDPIARPAPDVDGRWTVDAWAPLRGRVVNAGLKVAF